MLRRNFLRNTALITAATALNANVLATGKNKKKTILLWSAWDVVNIGDIGHTPGLLSVFEKYLPDVNVILLASMLNNDVREMLHNRFPGLVIIERDIFEDKIALPENRTMIEKADLFIRNSNTGPNTQYMNYLYEWNKPFGVFGQSLFSWFAEGEEGQKRVADINNAAFFYCRETISLDMLKKAQSSCKYLDFAPDGCFGIDVKDEAGGLQIMGKYGLEPRKFITIQLRTHTQEHEIGEMPPGYGKWKKTIENVPLDEARADKYIKLIQWWVKTTGNKVLIAPEAKKEMAQNKRFIYDRLPEEIKPYVVNLDRFWRVEEAAAVFSHAHTVVCHEPHSPIIALANGTPIIHTYSDEFGPKYFMFSDIGLGEWLLEHDTTPAEKMTEALSGIYFDYESAREKVKRSMDYVHQQFQMATENIRHILMKEV